MVQWMKKFLFSLLLLMLILVVGEVVCRCLLHEDPWPYGMLDERNTIYHFHSLLGWFPDANINVQWKTPVNRYFFVRSNDLGFRDRMHFKQQNKPRIVVMGDSFVWGYDSEVSERWTDILQQRYPEIEFFNLGVSGYGTDQELILAREYLPLLRPDVIILLFNRTDYQDNSTNVNYHYYYKPYFTFDDSKKLKLAGVPVGKSIIFYYAKMPVLVRRLFEGSYLFKGIFKFVMTRFYQPSHFSDPSLRLIIAFKNLSSDLSANFLLASVDKNRSLSEFSRENDIAFLEINCPDEYFIGGHWNAQGNKCAAEKFEKIISQLNIKH